MIKYSVRDVVCDYGIFENDKLIVILDSRRNALLISDILNCDLEHKSIIPLLEKF